MAAFALYKRVTAKRNMATAEAARGRLRAAKGPSEPSAALRERHDVRVRRVEGFDCYTVRPHAPDAAARAAIYLHGGAYVGEIDARHWALVGKLADAGVRVEVPIYGLAPRHTYCEAYRFVTTVYRELLADVAADRVSLVGDSAGGGLALGLAQTLGAAGLPQPRRLVLVAPWLDLTMGNPEVAAADRRDPWLGRAGLVEMGKAWAGGDDPADPRLSPINGPLAGLAPMDVYVGTRDLFLPDVLRFHRLALAAGAEIRVTVRQGAVHVYPLVPAPEGREAAAAIVADVAG